ncbi:NADH-quinone oxidoreductase subunit NuoN [Roseitalea porphyridii]|uniref:NADH-quinone oxidoreductase subunit N n=1 Tax=Roseitalea porphyridii TaxID=1852022 RepID=A0A4P6V1Y4_9HYPH|nr:NADH-quinone oxidoreductase subunit NuoN [Roseitalea porphyridii]QBK30420.1 NADH-quinone oxidoreductase subunit NuoN [Roseitalea porphyridii]
MTAQDLAQSLVIAAPELIIAVGAMALLMVGVFVHKDRANAIVTSLTVALLVAALGWMVFFTPTGPAFGGAYVHDAFSLFMKTLVLVGSTVALVMSVGFAREEKFDRFEFPILIALATLGMMLMVSADNLLGLYMALELQSLALYVIAAINRDSIRSTEAGLKYFVLGALSSGMMLYGISLIYGFTGHIDYQAIAGAIGGERSIGLLFGLVFLLVGLAFKISAVPFHMWTPDVYEGAPTPVTAFLAAAPKMAAMALLVRVVMEAFQPVTTDWQQIIVFISIASMLLGSFAAIGQSNIKRLMAYSSIGHMGYALVGLAAGSVAGVQGVMLYMAIYLAMTLGTFAFILAMRRKDEGNVEQISDLAGYAANNPLMATILTALMFSLTGIPPLAGFWAKWYVFLAAVEAGLWPLAIIGVLASVVGAYYYLRIIKIMWFDDAEARFVAPAGELRLVMGASGLFVLAYIVFGGPIAAYAETAARTFF